MESRVIYTSLLAVVSAIALAVLSGCEEEKEHTAPAIHDRDSVSVMTSYGVNTLISDSGVIKYRIVTERWDVNTIRKPSRWEFLKGIFFEQFDQQFHTEGYTSIPSIPYVQNRMNHRYPDYCLCIFQGQNVYNSASVP